ncbi:MAG: hypothetical protein PVJ05_15460, partial [Candidatus Thorarchaeota archaeon]
KGLLVTVSSDDPSLFHTDLNNEFIQIHKHQGFSVTELFQLSLNGIETAFIDDEKKRRMRESFTKEFRHITSQLQL